MSLDLLVLTNAVTDLVYEVKKEDLISLKLCNDSTELERILKDKKLLLQSPAGSPANVAFSAATLGLKVGIIGTLGEDNHSENYRRKVLEHGILDVLYRSKGKSGVCYTFITPDGERHFNTFLNNATKYKLKHTFFVPKVFHTSVYEIMNAPRKIKKYIKTLRGKGTKISVDLADRKFCEMIKKELKPILKMTNVLFTSHKEYRAVFNKNPTIKDFHYDLVCLKQERAGSSIISKSEGGVRLASYPTKLVNTNGAGDGYAAGVLYGYIKGFPVDLCGRIGHAIAAKICSQTEATLSEIPL